MPFVVAERVPWDKMCDTLNLKFMAEVQTTKGLLREHYFFLAQKIFNDYSASLEDFQSRSVSWAQFNKVTGRAGLGEQGPAWPWASSHPLFYPRRSCPVGDSPSGSGLMESSTSPRGASRVTGLIGEYPGPSGTPEQLQDQSWGSPVPPAHPCRLIIGFISKQYVCKLLSTKPDGTFLLRFSDSEIGGVTIAHVIRGNDGALGAWGLLSVLSPWPGDIGCYELMMEPCAVSLQAPAR